MGWYEGMTENDSRFESTRLIHLEVVAGIAPGVGVAAGACLVLAIVLATDDKGATYGQNALPAWSIGGLKICERRARL